MLHSVDLLWGYSDGGLPTSELLAHFMSHIARLAVDPENQVVSALSCDTFACDDILTWR